MKKTDKIKAIEAIDFLGIIAEQIKLLRFVEEHDMHIQNLSQEFLIVNEINLKEDDPNLQLIIDFFKRLHTETMYKLEFLNILPMNEVNERGLYDLLKEILPKKIMKFSISPSIIERNYDAIRTHMILLHGHHAWKKNSPEEIVKFIAKMKELGVKKRIFEDIGSMNYEDAKGILNFAKFKPILFYEQMYVLINHHNLLHV